MLHHEAATARRTLAVLLVGPLVWGLPVAAVFPGTGGELRLARGRWSAASRRPDHARAADRGGAVRRLPRRVPRPGAPDPWVAAVPASLPVTWVTFVPSSPFVLVGAPYVERLRGNRSLSAAPAELPVS